jgi:DNA-binding FadR family transcriptional regulator
MPDFNIRITEGAGETKTAQIFNQIASAILAGKFNAGDPLVSERALAEQLGVSRNIVRNAYQRLEDEGLVETSGTAGRRVRVSRRRRATGGAHVESRDRAASRAEEESPPANSAGGRRRG